MQLTNEQAQIVCHQNSTLQAKQNGALANAIVLINSFAGCGKTTTLRQHVSHVRNKWIEHCMQKQMPKTGSQHSSFGEHTAQMLQDKKFLYLVFNRDADQAAKRDFHKKDGNEAFVDVRTHHSLSLVFFLQCLRDKVESCDNKCAEPNICSLRDALSKIDNFGQIDFNDDGGQNDEDKNDLPIEFECDQERPFGLVRGDPALEVLSRFLNDPNSTVDGPTLHHTAFMFPRYVSESFVSATQRQVLSRALGAWQRSINGHCNRNTQKLVVSHNVTLKLFCCHTSKSQQFIAERYHTLLFDEAQDTDEILMRWIGVARQKVNFFLVGDAFQSIYNFKGAINAMQSMRNTDQLVQYYLSKSFRFGAKVARLANDILEQSGRFAHMDCEKRITSAAKFDTCVLPVHYQVNCEKSKLHVDNSTCGLSDGLAQNMPIDSLTTPSLSSSSSQSSSSSSRKRKLQEIVDSNAAAQSKKRFCCDNHQSRTSIAQCQTHFRPSDVQITAQHIYNTVKKCNETMHSGGESSTSCPMIAIGRKNNTLMQVAVQLTWLGVQCRVSNRLVEKFAYGMQVLKRFASLEDIDGRVEYIQTQLLRLGKHNYGKQYETMTVEGDLLRASGELSDTSHSTTVGASTNSHDNVTAAPGITNQTKNISQSTRNEQQPNSARKIGGGAWTRTIRPVVVQSGGCTYSSILSKVSDQLLDEFQILKLTLSLHQQFGAKTLEILPQLMQRVLQLNNQCNAKNTSSVGQTAFQVELATVHACKGGEWPHVIMCNDFPDIMCLNAALQFARLEQNKHVNLSNKTDNTKFCSKLQVYLLAQVPGSVDRDETVSELCRIAKSSVSLNKFCTQLNEEVHLYYVCVTRAMHSLHINRKLQRFQLWLKMGQEKSQTQKEHDFHFANQTTTAYFLQNNNCTKSSEESI